MMVAAALSTSAPLLQARPEWIKAQSVDEIIGKTRRSIVVVSNQGTFVAPDFRLYKPGIIPLGKYEQIEWFLEGDIPWIERPLRDLDQIIFDEKWFGPKIDRPFALRGCEPRSGIKYVSKDKQKGHRELFVASCEADVIDRMPRPNREVGYDLQNGHIESNLYDYKFKPDNHMLFETITFKQNDERTVVARDSDILIRSDVKNFFTLNFDSTDIESQLKASRAENFGVLGTLGFYLKVAFFKISLDLDTDVRFFATSAHIPMVLTIPVDASAKLNPKSGILYSFVLGDGVMESSSKIPRLKENVASRDEALTFCTGSQCHYEINFLAVANAGRTSPQNFGMQLMLPRRLVEAGMFPHFVDDVVDASSGMKWSIPKNYRGHKRVGIYLEVSGLKKGEHPWEFFMNLNR